MILEYNSKEDTKVNNVKLLSVYETEAYFYYKSIYTQKSYFYAEEKNFSLKCYVIIGLYSEVYLLMF